MFDSCPGYTKRRGNAEIYIAFPKFRPRAITENRKSDLLFRCSQRPKGGKKIPKKKFGFSGAKRLLRLEARVGFVSLFRKPYVC